MKKIVILMILLAVTAMCFAANPIKSRWNNGSLIYYPSNLPGNEYHVNSTLSTASDSGLGLDWETALATVDGAIAKCTANNGDIIWVAPGHQEVEALAVSIFDMDVAGVTIIGVSSGPSGPVASGAATLNNMPVFILDHADANAKMSAPNCKIKGLRFESDVVDCAQGIVVTAAADGYVIEKCVLRDGAAGEELVIAIEIVADADNGVILNNVFSTFASGGCANAILFAGGSDDTIVKGNIATGTYSAGTFLATAAASRNLSLINNTFTNQGAIAVDLHASTTGLMVGNYLAGTTSIAAALTDHDAMWMFQNYVTGEDANSGKLDPAADSD